MSAHNYPATRRSAVANPGFPMPLEFNKRNAQNLIDFAETIPDWQYDQNSATFEEASPRCCLSAHYSLMKKPLIPLNRNIIKFFMSYLNITDLESRYIVSINRVIVESAKKLGLPKPTSFEKADVIDRIKAIRERHTLCD